MNPIRPLTIKLITCNTKGCRSSYDVLIKTNKSRPHKLSGEDI